jgi:hypothetical protein
LIVWEASFGLRLTGIVLACAIAATICTHPEKAVFWFSVWFLGAGSYHLLRAGLVSPPFGLLGAGLIIGGMAIARLKSGSGLEAETAIAAGTALVIACRPMVEFRFASRFFSWAAGFSYTLAIHIPIVFLVVAIFQNLGFPRDKVPPSTLAFTEFGITVAICVLVAFLVSLVTERKTSQIRAAMVRMCPSLDRKPSGIG